MALTKCKECGSAISNKAVSCPQCGAKRPKKTSLITWFFTVIFGIAIINGFIGMNRSEVATPPSVAVDNRPTAPTLSSAPKAGSSNSSDAQIPLLAFTKDISFKEAENTPEVKKLRKEVDDIGQSVFYFDKSTPKNLGQNNFSIYLSRSADGKPHIRLKMIYHAESWLFIEKVTIKADEYRMELPLRKFNRDNNSEIWEWSDDAITFIELDAIEEIAKSKVAKIRYEGSKYHDDRVITPQEKAAIKNVLAAFQAWGGKI